MPRSAHLQLHPEAVTSLNAESELLIAEVHQVPPRNASADGFHPQIFASGAISEADVVGETKVGFVDGRGRETGRTFGYEGKQLGLRGQSFQKFWSVAEKIQQTQSFRDKVSLKCVADAGFEWVTKKYRKEITSSFCEYVVEECSKLLRDMEIWVPIYNVHAEDDLAVGSCLFRTIKPMMLDEWEQDVRSAINESSSRMEEQFRSRRKRMQGTLAATFKIHAEPDRGYQLALERAERAIQLLNFFHPAHGTLATRSYATLLGQENIQTTTTLILENGRVRGSQRGLSDQGATPWVLDRGHLQFLKSSGLDKVGALSEKQKKSEYDTCLLNALILYSKSSLSTVVSERLVYIFAALESMLLKNTTEPVQKNIGERLAFLTRKTAEERRRVVQVVDQVYKLRSSFLHHGEEVNESAVIEEFMRSAWTSFIVLIAELDRFQERSQMFDTLDNMKFT
jgi:hypothetical protein